MLKSLIIFLLSILFTNGAKSDFFNPPSEMSDKKKSVETPQEQEGLNKKIFKIIGGWTLLTAKPNGKKICYAVLYPKNRTGNMNGDDGDTSYILFHYFSRFDSRFSYHSKYTEDRSVTFSIQVAESVIDLQPYDDSAIAKSYNDDQAITQMLYLGNTMYINFESVTGQYFVDTFDVSEFSKVYDAMAAKCMNPLYSSTIKKLNESKTNSIS